MRKIIKYNEFYEKYEDALLLDVRSKAEFISLKKIPNSKNIYIYDLLDNVESYIGNNKDIFIVTLCNAGNRSGTVAELLNEQGYNNTFVLEGGIYGFDRWLKKNKK